MEHANYGFSHCPSDGLFPSIILFAFAVRQCNWAIIRPAGRRKRLSHGRKSNITSFCPPGAGQQTDCPALALPSFIVVPNDADV